MVVRKAFPVNQVLGTARLLLDLRFAYRFLHKRSSIQGAWFDGLQAGMNAAIAGMAAPVEILLRAGVEPNTTLVELRYSVVSDNFPVARASLILSLSSTLDRTTLKLKAGGD